MKLFEIKHCFSGNILFSLETESLKLTLEAAVKSGADLRGAYLTGAYLGGAYLRGAKNYVDNHDFFLALIYKQPIKTFTEAEWAMIGQIAVHRHCWGAIAERHGAAFLRILEVLEAAEFGEYAVKYREVLGLEPKAPAAEAAGDSPAEASAK